MKALSIARKTLLEYLREPLLLGLALAFPIMFIGVYYIAFGETDQGLASYLTVLVINEDAGATVGSEHWQAGAQLIDVMRDTEWEGQPVFDVSKVADRHAAEISLWERKVSLLLTIPPDFTQALLNASAGVDTASHLSCRPSTGPAIVSLVGDPNSDNFVFATSFLDDLVRQFVRYTVGWQSSLTVAYEFLPGTGTMSDFDFGVPGLIVFGTMFVVMFTASTLVRENVGGTLRRLRLTHTRARDLLVGVTLAQMVVALVQVPLTFVAAMAFGFRGRGSLPLAMGIGLLLTLSAVGLGLIVACFARNDGEAANLAGVVLVVMVLMSGAMYPMPDAPIATVAGRTIQIYDILPPAHAGEAMRRVLVLGDGPGAIVYELAAMTILAVVFLVAGVFLYQRLQLREV